MTKISPQLNNGKLNNYFYANITTYQPSIISVSSDTSQKFYVLLSIHCRLLHTWAILSYLAAATSSAEGINYSSRQQPIIV